MTAQRGRGAEAAASWSPGDVGPAAGVVKIRLSGAAEDIDTIAQLLGAAVIDRSAPYSNRRDPGVRVYLTAFVTSTGPGA